jgi:hypothetical protein
MPARSFAEYSAGWRCLSAPDCRSPVCSDQVSCRGISPKRAGGLFLALLRRYDGRRAGKGSGSSRLRAGQARHRARRQSEASHGICTTSATCVSV